MSGAARPRSACAEAASCLRPPPAPRRPGPARPGPARPGRLEALLAARARVAAICRRRQRLRAAGGLWTGAALRYRDGSLLPEEKAVNNPRLWAPARLLHAGRKVPWRRGAISRAPCARESCLIEECQGRASGVGGRRRAAAPAASSERRGGCGRGRREGVSGRRGSALVYTSVISGLLLLPLTVKQGRSI